MTERAAPQYCPYCGEDTLRPWGELTEHARWHCESCLRVFEIRFQGTTGRD
ncbi:MAG TPA: hypothetical protein VM097_01730 [Mycobacteriales bacterium]|nr:hypothetical protein [Mycobacteriales bacterium]